MRLMKRMVFTGAAFALAFGMAPLAAQDAVSPQAQSQERQQDKALSASGELTRVDAEKKMFWIKSASGQEQQFSYTDETEVSGEGKNVEGLATMTGTQVDVEYHSEAGSAVATKIDIKSADSSDQAQPAAPREPATPQSQPQPQQ